MTALHRTPRTALTWSTLEEWYACARSIESRRYTALHHEQARLHVEALPVAVVYRCANQTILANCRSWLCHGPTDFMQPARGTRGHAPHTPLFVAIINRIAQLDRQADHASVGMGHNSRAAAIA